MAKRNAGNKARATKRVLDLPGQRQVVEASNKTLVQLQAEKIAEKYFTDMMSAAGVSQDRMALEVLYWLPRDFLDLYQELYMRALRNTDGGAGGQGEAAAQTGALGKAKATTATNGKRYKKYWTVADEHVLEMKGRVDRRLRAMTRDMRLELEELDWKRERKEKVRPARSGSGIRASCSACHIVVSLSWKYCPKCGSELAHERGEQTKMRLSEDWRRNREA